MIALVLLVILIPLFVDWLDQRRTIKRLERMNAKALIQISELIDDRDELIEKLIGPQVEEWAEFIEG